MAGTRGCASHNFRQRRVRTLPPPSSPCSVAQCHFRETVCSWRDANRVQSWYMYGMVKTIIFACAVGLLGCSKGEAPPAGSSTVATGAPAPEAPAKKKKDPEAARKLIAEGAVVIDVRSAEEYSKEHLQQAPNIPVDEFAGRIGEVDKMVSGDKTKPVVVYCAAGSRAARAKQSLEAAGYTNVVNGGGYDDVR